MSLDSAKDFLELTRVKMASGATGLFMIGGGVPKNFAQDTVVAADILGEEADMHKYASRSPSPTSATAACPARPSRRRAPGARSTTAQEQMVWGEATVMMPLIAGYAWHKKAAAKRRQWSFNKMLEAGPVAK